MYTKEELLQNSIMTKIRARNGQEPIKGVLTKEEAALKIKYLERIDIVCNVNTGQYFFTDDYCIGANYLPSEWVPSSHYFPSRVVPRESLPTGVIDTLDKHILIFHDDGILIDTVEELIDLLNQEITCDELKD